MIQMTVEQVQAGGTASMQFQLGQLKNNLEKVIRGKSDVVEHILVSILTGESILIQDVPGVGKTTLAKALAASLDLSFQRIQCTPDLLPADVFGMSVFNPQSGEFHFRKGPVFCNILLVDEINRASPRTQSALLEAMAEKQVTIEGRTYSLEPPFIVIATQNPFGFRGTFPLPESQLDRFLMQVSMEYPDRDSELEILYNESKRASVDALQSVLSLGEVVDLQDRLNDVRFDESLANYLLAIVAATRHDERIELGCSPRGSIKLFRATKAVAVLRGRDYVLPDDIQHIAPLVLRHRVVLNQREQKSGSANQVDELLRELMGNIDVPV